MEMHRSIANKALRVVLATALAAGLTIAVSGTERAVAAEPASAAASARTDGANEAHAPFAQYLSDRTPTGSSVGWGELYVDKSYDDTPLSLLMNGKEQTFDHGFWAHADSSIYFNDIQEYGYERFDAMVGISHTARATDKSAEVVFKVVADGQVIWQSDPLTECSDAVPVSVDVSRCKVVQLVAEAVNKSAHPNNHAVWADALFSKAEATPWLSVSAKEFSNPEQVTPANILEGTYARTLSGPVGETDAPVAGSDGTLRNGKEGNDLSNAITYTTDYVEGQTGVFSVTYSVTDAQGLTRSRMVDMTVRESEVFRTEADIDYLTQPFASFLYAGRDYFDEQGKAAFDLSVATLLSFGKNVDAYQLVEHWGQVWKVTVDLQAHGIYMSTADAGYLCSTIMDCEPRTFHVKDWGTQVSAKGGIADTVTFYVASQYGNKDETGEVYYHTRLLKAETNASRFLANIEDGMTDAQRLRAVLSPYASWIRYEGGGQVMDEALADGRSVCGGNARGSVYLSQRMGIKAYWVRTTPHAWSNVKLNRDDSGVSGESGLYYRIDLLAGTSCFLSVDAEHEGFRGHHKQIHFNRMKGYPDMVSGNYPYAWTGWPSVTLEVEDSWVVLAPEDAATFDARKFVVSAMSVYDGDVKDSVSIDCGDLRANGDGEFSCGYYPIAYTVSDTHGNTATATVNVQVVGGDVVKANAENCSSNANSAFLPSAAGDLPSLWNGAGETVYGYGIAQNDGGKSATYAVDRGNGVRFTCVDAWVGLHRSTRDSEWGYNGKVRFVVKATVPTADGGTEEAVLYTSPDMTRYTVQEHVLVKIPDDAISVTLTSESLGSGNGHARWGNPRFFTSDILDAVPVAPVIFGVEDDGFYDAPVVPVVEGASEVKLYRKNLPVLVDPETGLPVEDASFAGTDEVSGGAALGSDDWGDELSGYQVGSAIEAEGVYTLVAANDYKQCATVSFTIRYTASTGPDEGGDQGSGGDEGGASGGSDGSGEPGSSDDSGSSDGQHPGDDSDQSGSDGSGSDGSGDQQPDNGGDETPSLAFPDVTEDDWYVQQGVVDFVVTHGIMTGVEVAPGFYEFQGNAVTSRGMFVTMLHRVEKAPSSAGEGFADVASDSWYAGSSKWAAQENIATGFFDEDGKAVFRGDDLVTREQMAVFLFRYAAWLGMDTSARADRQIDGASTWAADAMSWAVAEGIIKGDDDTGAIRPGDGATRAEAAVVVMRMVDIVA